MVIRLQDRDSEILRHIARYRLSVKEALRGTAMFGGASDETIKKVMARLRQGGYVKTAPLYEQRWYWHLTARGCNHVAEHESLGRALKEEAKRRSYAILSFCCMDKKKRTRLTPREFKEKFPHFFTSGDRIDYYLDKDRDVPRLGFIRVDSRGMQGRWSRIIGQLHQDISKRCDRPGFRDLVLQGRFVITVLTSNEDKAERLSAVVKDKGFPPEVEIKFHVVPELIPLGDPKPQN